MDIINEKIKFIEGWMDLPDLEWLYKTASTISENGIIVEVGSWKGRSSAAIFSGAKTKDVFCIDLWCGNHGVAEGGYTGIGINAYNDFINNLKKALDKVPYIITADSSKSAQLFENESVDWVFIDASHLEEDVKKDVKAWIPKLKPNGLLSGHDWGKEGEAVKKALNSIMCLKNISLSGCNIWYIYKNNIKFK